MSGSTEVVSAPAGVVLKFPGFGERPSPCLTGMYHLDAFKFIGVVCVLIL